MAVEFRILGPLEVVLDGRAVAVGGLRMRALVAILLLHPNEVIAAERLIEELWGERAPSGAANTLQVYISRLRKLLGPEMVVTQAPGYLLRVDPDTIDLHPIHDATG